MANSIQKFLTSAVLAFVAANSHTVFAQGASISLQPSTGTPGSLVKVEGTDFVNSPCGVNLLLDDPSGPHLGFASINDGNFTAMITIPPDTAPGAHTVIAQGLLFNGEFCGEASGEQARAVFTVIEGQSSLDRNIYLENRVLLDPGINDDFLAEIQSSSNPVHGIVQLQNLPMTDNGDLEKLQGLGIEVLDYLNGVNGIGTAYLASISPNVLSDSDDFQVLVRGLQPILPEDKLPTTLLLNDSSEVVDAVLRFFRDVDPVRVPEIFSRLGLKAERNGQSQDWETQATPAQLRQLAENDLVQWVQEKVPFLELLDEVRAVSDVEPVQNLNTGTGVYGGLSGNGVEIAIMDSGVDDQHDDFLGRIIRSKDDTGAHGSHVAGIAAGSGFQSDKTDNNGDPNGGTPFQWRGMAPEAGIAAYGSAGGNPTNYDDAINNFGVDLSNHSYVLALHGEYEAGVATLDSIIRGDSPGIPARPAAYAAGNNGTGTQYGVITGYFSAFSSCKNCVAIASIDKNQIHSGFSSMGPTPDGRMKPEISAVGSSVTSVASDTFASIGNGYRSTGGTSMASPAVAGIMGLMLEQYADTFGVDLDLSPPLPSTLKAILLQTAVDLAGTDPSTNPDTGNPVVYGAGPDWATGYGLADANAAVDLISDQTFLEDQVSTIDHTDSFVFNVSPGETRNRVTLAWDDIAGTPNANDAAAQLVNDLDLIVVDPNGNEFQPLVLPLLTPGDCDGNAANGVQVGTCPGLDPAGQNYFGPAAPGTDRRNNVEQVVIEDPAGLTAGNWTARVSVLNDDGLTVRMPLGGSQDYSLVLDNNSPPIADAGPDQTLECEGPTGTQVSLDGSGSSDPDGDELTFSWNGPFLEDGGTTTGINPTVTMLLGNNLTTLTVTDTREAFDTDDVSITVEDTTPPLISDVTASPNVLWPPNHKMVPVEIGVTVADVCDDQSDCQIMSVTSNEAVNGQGDGNTSPDWNITGDLTLELRAERSGKGNGRVYTITIECTDDSGNTSMKDVIVEVPHNQGKKL